MHERGPDAALGGGRVDAPRPASAAPLRSAAGTASRSELARPTGSTRPSRVFRTLALVGVGLTIAAAAATIAAWRAREGHVDKFNRRAQCSDADPSELTAACQRELDSADSAASVMLVGAVAGGASLVLAGVFLMLDANRPRERASLGCGAGPAQLGVSCTLHF